MSTEPMDVKNAGHAKNAAENASPQPHMLPTTRTAGNASCGDLSSSKRTIKGMNPCVASVCTVSISRADRKLSAHAISTSTSVVGVDACGGGVSARRARHRGHTATDLEPFLEQRQDTRVHQRLGRRGTSHQVGDEPRSSAHHRLILHTTRDTRVNGGIATQEALE